MVFPIIPTMRGMVMLAVSVLAVGVSLVNVNLASCIAAASMCAVVLASMVLSTMSLSGITVRRGMMRDGHVNGRVHVTFTVVNKRRRNRQAVIVQEVLPFVEEPIVSIVVDPMLSREEKTVTRTVIAVRRGYYKLGKVTLLGGDPAGLFRRAKGVSLPEEMMIYPEIVRIPWMPVFAKHRLRPSFHRAHDQRVGAVQGVLRSPRVPPVGRHAFHPLEGQRAGIARLMTREYESHNYTLICVMIDVDRRSVGEDRFKSNFEYLIMSAASICEYLSATYCDVMLVTARDDTAAPVVIHGNGKWFKHSASGPPGRPQAMQEECGRAVRRLRPPVRRQLDPVLPYDVRERSAAQEVRRHDLQTDRHPVAIRPIPHVPARRWRPQGGAATRGGPRKLEWCCLLF